jgi:glycogen synthase
MSSKEQHIEQVKKQIADIQNNHQTKLTFGYYGNKAEPTREEGDVWTDEHDRTWTKKDGIIQNISHMQYARMPLFCPECEQIMSHRLNTKYWNLRGKCMDCVVREETKMRVEGTWEAYQEQMMRANYIAFLKDAIAEVTDLYNTVKAPEVIHADDHNILMVEKWDVDIDTIKADLQNELDILTDVLERVERGEE